MYPGILENSNMLFVFRRVLLLLAGSALLVATPVIAAEQVLLESNEVKVTGLDFEAQLADIPQKDRAEVLSDRGRISKLLQRLLINKTMASRARAAGLDKDPLMAKQMELAADSVLEKAQIHKAMESITVPDFEMRARELYRLDQAKYTLPEQVHASHILVSFKDRSEEEALKRIKDIREQAMNGKDFASLALEYSDDPSAKNNKGDLGFFARDKMVKPFSDAAFAMTEPGEISEPVKSRFGYHIIKFHEKKDAVVQDFDKVKEGIIDGLRSSYISDARKKMVNEILLDPSLKLNDAAVDSYKTELPASEDIPPESGGSQSEQP